MPPTTRQFDQVPGAGSDTSGLIARGMLLMKLVPLWGIRASPLEAIAESVSPPVGQRPRSRVSEEDPPTPLAVLRRVFGYSSFRGQQQEIIEHVIAGGDAIVLMPTGGGKSLCYQLPALLRPGLGVVVSPLSELMKDQVDALRQAGVRAATLNSGLATGEAATVEREIREGALDLLYVSPRRLMMPGRLRMAA